MKLQVQVHSKYIHNIFNMLLSKGTSKQNLEKTVFCNATWYKMEKQNVQTEKGCTLSMTGK